MKVASIGILKHDAERPVILDNAHDVSEVRTGLAHCFVAPAPPPPPLPSCLLKTNLELSVLNIQL